jgi:hypothetical protein
MQSNYQNAFARPAAALSQASIHLDRCGVTARASRPDEFRKLVR